MWVLAVNSGSREIRYYYSGEDFEIPDEIKSWNIFVFNEPPLVKTFAVRNNDLVEQITNIPTVWQTESTEPSVFTISNTSAISAKTPVYFMEM